ncbi:MAG: hypothetical protein C0623_08715 [Desulfuromonas sp.]|nr:MAG: hypothetical protein C0623_08715 [Desulfuromonas sp.]
MKKNYTLLLSALFLLLLFGCGGDSGSSGVVLAGDTGTLAGDGTQAFQDSIDGTGATAQFNFPRGLATDGDYLYLAESTGRRVRRIDPMTGETVNFAGDGTAGSQDSTDGTGMTASFAEPSQIVYLGNHLYLADSAAHNIRKIHVPTGETSTIAGTGVAGYQDSTDGTGATAQFNRPTGITHDESFLYVADQDNCYIRRVQPLTGETTTLSGNGVCSDQESTDGTGATAGFNAPIQVYQARPPIGTFLYVGTYSRIFKVNKNTGAATFFAGNGTPAFQDSTDGTGATARFNLILGLCSDGYFLYVGDASNNRVRKVDLGTGNTTTLAGDGTAAFQDSTDGTGATARFSSPRACVNYGGSLFVADGGNHRVRMID